MEALDALGFELSQFVSHTIGFLITVWILKKYAWGPLLSLMDERRDKIAGEFDSIEKEKSKVAEQQAEYEAKMKEVDNERRARLVEAVEEGKKVAADIKATAQEEVKQLRTKAQADLVREVAKAKVQLKSDMIEITMAAAGHVIRERLDDAKHRELIGSFIDNVEKA